MVGTSPTVRPSARAESNSAPGLGDGGEQTHGAILPHSGRTGRRPIGPGPGSRPAAGPARPPRRSPRARPGPGRRGGGHGGLVAPGGRTGQRRGRAQLGHVVEGGPHQVEVARRSGTPAVAATRSAWPRTATTWFEAMTAAAWWATQSGSATSNDRPPRSSTTRRDQRIAGHREPGTGRQSTGARLGVGHGHQRVQHRGAGVAQPSSTRRPEAPLRWPPRHRAAARRRRPPRRWRRPGWR